jgi:hypothetical protein
MCRSTDLSGAIPVKLLDHHVAPDGTEGYSIEAFNAVGDTIPVTAVPSTALEPCPKTKSYARGR